MRRFFCSQIGTEAAIGGTTAALVAKTIGAAEGAAVLEAAVAGIGDHRAAGSAEVADLARTGDRLTTTYLTPRQVLITHIIILKEIFEISKKLFYNWKIIISR